MGGVKEGEEGKRRGGRQRGEKPAGNMQMPSFSGMPGQGTTQGSPQNLIIYGACLAVMAVMLLIVRGVKRRR